MGIVIRTCRLGAAWVITLCALVWATNAIAQPQVMVMASTTSTEQSGLFSHLLPRFTQVTGITVRVVALGTGQALDMARRGDADVLFVHDTAAEEKLVSEGFALPRRNVMFNDFVLVGPAADPLHIKGANMLAALQKLANANAPFLSRGDKSGTHAAELRLWAASGVNPLQPKLPGYKECGCGMGAALNIAASTNAYVLTDRGTWLSFKNRGGLNILVEGDKSLFNQYGVLVVSPARHAHVKHALAQRFSDWVTSNVGQAAIADYRIGGEQLFFANAVASR